MVIKGLLKKKVFPLFLTSDSKKPGQTKVVIQYCSLSRFFLNQTLQGLVRGISNVFFRTECIQNKTFLRLVRHRIWGFEWLEILGLRLARCGSCTVFADWTCKRQEHASDLAANVAVLSLQPFYVANFSPFLLEKCDIIYGGLLIK